MPYITARATAVRASTTPKPSHRASHIEDYCSKGVNYVNSYVQHSLSEEVSLLTVFQIVSVNMMRIGSHVVDPEPGDDRTMEPQCNRNPNRADSSAAVWGAAMTTAAR